MYKTGLPVYMKGGRYERQYDNAKNSKKLRNWRRSFYDFVMGRRWDRLALILVFSLLVLYYYYPRSDDGGASEAPNVKVTGQIGEPLGANATHGESTPSSPALNDGKTEKQGVGAGVGENGGEVGKGGGTQEMPKVVNQGKPPPSGREKTGPPKQGEKVHGAGAGAGASKRLTDKEKKARIVDAFRHAWKGYEDHAWGYDELHPISKRGSNWFGLGLTIVDSLDTAWIMGQTDIFEKAKKWILTEMKFDHDGDSNVFELTIRVLGGLLSAYHLSGETDKALLAKAVELADILLLAFETESKIPVASVNFKSRNAVVSHFTDGVSSVSEVATLQMEFKYLTQLTGKEVYWNKVQKVSKILGGLPKTDGLVPIFITVDTGQFAGNEIRLGSRGDSYYEYLAKQWMLTNYTEPAFQKYYNEAVDGVRKHLLAMSTPNDLFFVGELQNGAFHPKMDHLVCFLPGTLAVAATGGKRVTRADREKMDLRSRMDLELAEELAQSCYEMYRQTPTGLASEIVKWHTKKGTEKLETLPVGEGTESLTHAVFKIHKAGVAGVGAGKEPAWTERLVNGKMKSVGLGLDPDAEIRQPATSRKPQEDFYIDITDGHNLLRPETVESLFILYRITGNLKYREWAWQIFEAFEKWCRIPSGGYSSLDDVRSTNPTHRDKMETFFLGETLKYFYLIFAGDGGDEKGLTTPAGRILDLHRFVYNTEAHPFPIFDVREDIKSKLLWI
ncbi:mannosyl-oligosaccharide alpha-1,2-mannosidase [Borealophlyctis nickersoniae]|nr:mannosyl-oligosaccharide alpha-1,2-mannosidase [Borealophlyctis nickersoniae]